MATIKNHKMSNSIIKELALKKKGGPTMRISTKISIILLSFVFVVFFTVQAFGQEWSTEQKELWNVEQQDWELMKKGDIETIKANLIKDFVYWCHASSMPGGRLSYANAITRRVKIVSYKLMPYDVRISGNVGIVLYAWTFTNPDGIAHSGRNTNTYIKKNGEWQMMGGMSASCTKPSPCPPF